MKGYKLFYLLFSILLINFLNPETAKSTPVTYTYTGNTFTDLTNRTSDLYEYNSSDSLSVTLVTTDGFLAENINIRDITAQLQYWSITDGHYTLDSNTAHSHSALLAEVNGVGEITDWSIAIESIDWAETTSGVIGQQMISKTYLTAIDSASLSLGLGSDTGYAANTGEVRDSPGMWRTQTQSNPIPEPSTSLLLIIGLIGFAGIHRKQTPNI